MMTWARVLLLTAAWLSLLTADSPGDSVDPTRTPYLADHIEMGTNEVVYLLSKTNKSVFRWSVATEAYLTTIPLIDIPTFMTYSPDLHRLYFAYSSGKITTIDLHAESFEETLFVNSPQTPRGLATAGEFLFVVDPSGAWDSHFTYSPEGTLISQVEWRHYSREYIWSEANRKMYYLRDGTSPNDLIWGAISSTGVIGEERDSPYHSSSGISHPIRVSPDGSMVILGSGRMYDGYSLEHVNTLPNTISDATWRGPLLFTLREPTPGITELQQWDPDLAPQGTHSLTGSPLRCFSISRGLLVALTRGGTTELLIPEGVVDTAILSIDSLPDGVGSSAPLPYGTHIVDMHMSVSNHVGLTTETNGTRYSSAGWSGTGSAPATGSGNSLSFLMEQDTSLTWVWQPTHHLLEVNTTGDGTVNATNQWLAHQSNITLLATPTFGGRFLRWIGDVPPDVATSREIDLPMDRARTIRAMFASKTSTSGLLQGDWPTYGNGPAHTGYFPGVLAQNDMTERWSRTFGSGINQVAVGGGKIYITPTQYFEDAFLQVLDQATGTNLWQYTFARCFSINPPTYDNGAVYVQRGNHSGDTHLWQFDAASGTIGWQAPHAAQWEHYMAPTIADGRIWVNGGSYGGMYGFEQENGTELFYYGTLEQYDEWTPTYHNGVLYSWVEGNFRAHDPGTGALRWELDLGWDWHGWSTERTIATSGQLAFVTVSARLFAIDLSTRRVAWSVAGNFEGTPAVANGIVYALSGSTVEAYAADDGTPQITYRAPRPLTGGNIVVCDNALFVASGSQTHIFDIGGGTPRQTLASGGQISLADDVLYVAGASGLHAYGFESAPTTYTLQVSGGQQQLSAATPTYGTYTLLQDAEVTLSIDTNTITTTDARFHFAGWQGTGDIAGSGPEHTLAFTATTDSTLTWQWITEHPLALVATHGVITGAVPGWTRKGFVYDLFPNSNHGYAFDHWLVNGVHAGNTSPLPLTINSAVTVEAVFVPIFIDVTPHTESRIFTWSLNPQTGTYFLSLELHNPATATKTLLAPFWYVHPETESVRLMRPDGIETNSGLPYLDITAAVEAALALVGNGDANLDPGETVRITGIELFSRDRRPPAVGLYAIWADPPGAAATRERTDTDADGIPNSWERQFRGVLNEHDPMDADGDSDGDGCSNLHEYHADTDPANARDQLRVEQLSTSGSNWMLSWRGGSNATQFVDWSADLISWSCVYTNTPPTRRTEQFHILRDTHPTGFFRLRVPAR